MENIKKSTGLYIHVPYCVHKCAYCDFYSQTNFSDIDKFVDAVCKSIALIAKKCVRREFDTIYIGGGTPSLLEARHIEAIGDAIYNCLDVRADAEFTVEANPATLNDSKLFAMKSIGVNRLSIGVQSAQNSELRDLSRIHNFDGFISSYDLARKAGFDNISVDLMYGIPEQNLDSLVDTIDKITALSPEHISLYGLRVEPDTPFGKMGDKLVLPDEDTQCEMYTVSVERLRSCGYLRYEFSNFAKDGKVSRHNLRYWMGEEYFGVGPSAHSYVDGERYAYAASVVDYITAIENGSLPEKSESYMIDENERERERIIFGLRLEGGIECTDDLKRRSRIYVDNGFMKIENDRLSFTTKGVLVSNMILAELVDQGDLS